MSRIIDFGETLGAQIGKFLEWRYLSFSDKSILFNKTKGQFHNRPQPIEGSVWILRESISIGKWLIGKEFSSQISLDSASTIVIDVPLYTDVHMKDMLSAIS